VKADHAPTTRPTYSGLVRVVGLFNSWAAIMRGRGRTFAGFCGVGIGGILLGWTLWSGLSGFWLERQDRARLQDALLTPVAQRAQMPIADALGILQIQRLGWSVSVRESTSARDLARGAGWISGTAVPGGAGNVGIAGHRDTFFRNLADVRVGDEITLSVPFSSTSYTVMSTMIVDPQETGVLAQTGTPTLTLVTCYPFFFIGPAPKRFIVKAEASSAR
jgi:LPXTG-site transpeptidase (sortase) family protein